MIAIAGEDAAVMSGNECALMNLSSAALGLTGGFEMPDSAGYALQATVGAPSSVDAMMTALMM